MDEEARKQEELSREIDQTKASLVGKLEALENQLVGTVQSASDTVSETVDAVKNTVETVVDKVQSAGEIFNIKKQTQRHPWAAFGTSMLVGCMAGYFLLGGRKKTAQASETAKSEYEPEATAYKAASRMAEPVPETHSEPKPEKEHGWFRDEVDSFLGLAVGSVMGLVRDVAVEELPQSIGKNVAEELDKLTTRLGGKPIEGPVLKSEKQPAA